jgi:hypothetical protein
MPPNPFDQACRYLAKLDSIAFMAWLLGLLPTRFGFRRWLDTRLVRFPGEPDRTCDTVAFLEDLTAGHVPWAVVLEFQIEPDPLMFGRLLGYFSPLWLELKPGEERGDRFQLGAVLVNLTGHGNVSRLMDWPEVGLHTGLKIVERNLSEISPEEVLTGIANGTAPSVVLPFIPLMQGGGESGTILKWKDLAGLESDTRRRGDYAGLALVFAEAAGCWDSWKDALKEWHVIQSKQVNEWQEQGRTEGAANCAVNLLLHFLGAKFGQLPDSVVHLVQSVRNPNQIGSLLVRAGQSATIDEWVNASRELTNGASH